jgi:hypothetical protein
LLAQKEVALVLGHGGDDLILDFRAELEDFEFATEEREKAGEPDFGLGQFQEVLALFEAEVEVGGDEVGKAGGVFGVEGGAFDFFGEGGGKFYDLLEFAGGVAGEGGEFDSGVNDVFEFFDAGDEVGGLGGIFLDAEAAQALDENADTAIGGLEHLEDASGAAVEPEVGGGGVFDLGIALKHKAEKAVAGDDVVNEADALRGFDEERGGGVGKDNDVAETEDGKSLGQGLGPDFGAGGIAGAGLARSEDIDEF